MLGQRACVDFGPPRMRLFIEALQQRGENVSRNVVFESQDNDACDVAAMSQLRHMRRSLISTKT